MREAGASATQELGFTFANAIEYVTQAINSGLKIDEFAPRLSFFFVAQNNLLEEVAKFTSSESDNDQTILYGIIGTIIAIGIVVAIVIKQKR